MKDNVAEALWKYVQDNHPAIFHGPITEDEEPEQFDVLYSNIKQFFDLKNHRIDNVLSAFSGTYAMFSRSSRFYDLGCYVASEMTISETEGKSISVLETQKYSGQLGATALQESYQGFLMPKSSVRIIIAAEEKSKFPRMYFLKEPQYGASAKTVEFFQGFTITHSQDRGGYFQTNFFCQRLKPGETVKCDIYEREKLKDRVIESWIYS